MLNVVNQFFQSFGASVVVPIIIFIIAVCLRVRVKTALMSALYAGVGLVGFSWVINEFTPVVTKVVNRMVDSTGINLPIVDIGWQAGSLASFSSSIGLTFFVISIVVELVLFACKLTRVFLPSNIWNNFSYMIWVTMAYYVTHNYWLSMSLGFILMLYTLLFAETQANRWSKYYQIDNATVASLHNIEQTVPAIILDPLWNILRFNRVKLTPTTFKKKLGIWGEPITMGVILGLLIGILANLTRLTKMSAWGQIDQFAIQLAAVMTIFPLITNVFAKAFLPLTEEINQRQAGNPQAGEKRWFLAVDDGVGYGEAATLMSGIILIPIIVVMAFVLPGNQTLPVVDLVALPYMVESIVAISRGNILKVVATGFVWFSIGLYASTWLGATYTATLSKYGIAIPAGVALITSFNLMARPISALIFAAFISQNPIWIGVVIAIYLVLVYALRRYRPQIWAYLERMAAKNA